TGRSCWPGPKARRSRQCDRAGPPSRFSGVPCFYRRQWRRSCIVWPLGFCCSEVAMPIPQPISNQQTVGNIGLYYVCYRLSCLGWNVMPTARNAKGIDILIYSQAASRTRTIHVKALYKGTPVPLSNKLDHLFGDFVVVCRHVIRETPV